MEKLTHLVSVVEFVKQFDYVEEDFENAFVSIRNYANFLSQPLELWMFIPCDSNGNVLQEPESLKGYYETHPQGMEAERKDVETYKKAKSKCLFEGFVTKELYPPSKSFQVTSESSDKQICTYKAQPDYFIWNYRTIEDMAKINITLSATALNQIY